MKTTKDFLKMKQAKEKIAMMTAYDFPASKLAEQAGIDLILVGDSVGMVALGYDSTVPVTLEDMILHTKAVRRGAHDTFVVTDMPFMTYHISDEDTLANAARLIQEAGAHAVKVEGAGDVINRISRLTASGVPVMGHLGLTPQSVGVLGGYKVQGKDSAAAEQLIKDAKKVEEAGAFSLVLECIPKQLTEIVAAELSIPVIGIGAGNAADGQVLVYHDLIGYGVDRVPKFVKQYASISSEITEAIGQYVSEVKAVQFPGDEHSFTMKEEQLAGVYGGKE
ncbi:3-methyl-2-oxobutanoate hydroxymethyltransferase [Pseudalkalibacillus caeni]|uniref:3-methyl-2-oxobutanoate hydroxymethyltransferase n=1 Tax=Exobacillus caeni TaxID=2574798 RepID=A0A5R9F2V9_9BACL|nr:3-methyl-2-oxobutanoate hydroxymethyltransferase [Pseudalkalibacillus caeni]TLS35888.1 3-methyl-2-oxobutanoate hydroxymethyltransferase [Pseudalkalibacillus caeni]